MQNSSSSAPNLHQQQSTTEPVVAAATSSSRVTSPTTPPVAATTTVVSMPSTSSASAPNLLQQAASVTTNEDTAAEQHHQLGMTRTNTFTNALRLSLDELHRTTTTDHHHHHHHHHHAQPGPHGPVCVRPPGGGAPPPLQPRRSDSQWMSRSKSATTIGPTSPRDPSSIVTAGDIAAGSGKNENDDDGSNTFLSVTSDPAAFAAAAAAAASSSSSSHHHHHHHHHHHQHSIPHQAPHTAEPTTSPLFPPVTPITPMGLPARSTSMLDNSFGSFRAILGRFSHLHRTVTASAATTDHQSHQQQQEQDDQHQQDQHQQPFTRQDSAGNILTRVDTFAPGGMGMSIANTMNNSMINEPTASGIVLPPPALDRNTIANTAFRRAPTSSGSGLVGLMNNNMTRTNTAAGRNASFNRPPNLARLMSTTHLDDEGEMIHQQTVNFAQRAVGDFGHLDPLELALLQAQQDAENADDADEDAQEQAVGAAELLALIEFLNEKEFALLGEALHRQMAESLGSDLMYSGTAWYLPQIDDVDSSSPEYADMSCCTFDVEAGLRIVICGKVISFPVLSILVRLCFLVLVWFLLWLALPSALMEPGGAIFDMVSTFLVCSVLGGILARILGIPPLLCIVGFAIFWANIPGNLAGGIPGPVRDITSTVGLTMILIRTGLAISVKTIKPALGTILSMATLPLATEIVVHGFVATALIDYGGHKVWPFLQAATAAGAASAVTGATTLLLRSWGYNISRGVGTLLVPVVSLDMSLSIFAINFVASLIFSTSDVGWLIGLGPLQIVVGIIAGILLGLLWFYGVLKVLFWEARKLPHGRYCRGLIRRNAVIGVFALCLLGLVCVFLGKHLGVGGGGSIAALLLAATVNHCIASDDSPEHHQVVKSKMYTKMSSLWDLLICPALATMAMTRSETVNGNDHAHTVQTAIRAAQPTKMHARARPKNGMENMVSTRMAAPLNEKSANMRSESQKRARSVERNVLICFV